ncbi:peptidylprolyl isomerase [Brevibacillus antibioticus]|uniref:Peptidyl-prolyl cis-trans isomerase n=1 Tax=Brevibacillus antibioticus TaxID=2570228 RepID=A0A4U2Y3Y5_9BACL|nr:peptidylprolyl isomerase [Brevibacillus antibioticus]TKI55196.1 peptidylprolyl isomerase [Brevibacillus antibioticus]
MKRTLITVSSVLLSISLLVGCSNSAAPEQNNQGQPVQQEKPKDTAPAHPATPGKYKEYPAMTIDQKKDYHATISTSMGDVTIDLFEKDAPLAVNNFVFLAKDKFYDGIKFHRIIKDFMIQTGDPLGTGRGGPGYTFEDELKNGHKYEPGVVAMANSGKNTNGSQFFIGSGPDVKGLDNSPDYTIFGKVTGGMDVVQKIAGTKVKKDQTGEPSVPEQTITIKSITITEK